MSDPYYEQAKAMLWELYAHVCREDDDGLCFKCMGILTDGLAAAAQPVWTTEKPTTPGQYWYRRGASVSIVEVVQGSAPEKFVRDAQGRETWFGDVRGGSWAGPLPPPKEK